MLLRYSSTSPFARKVMVVASELGISHLITLQPAAVRTHDPELFGQNPLGKIPVLITGNGDSIFDSKVICEYLDLTFGGGRLMPLSGDERWTAMAWINLADGMVDAGLLARQEAARTPPQRSEEAVRFQLEKVERSLDWFNGKLSIETSAFGMKEIALACAVEWLNFRYGEDYTLAGRSRLAKWYDSVKLESSFASVP